MNLDNRCNSIKSVQLLHVFYFNPAHYISSKCKQVAGKIKQKEPCTPDNYVTFLRRILRVDGELKRKEKTLIIGNEQLFLYLNPGPVFI